MVFVGRARGTYGSVHAFLPCSSLLPYFRHPRIIWKPKAVLWLLMKLSSLCQGLQGTIYFSFPLMVFAGQAGILRSRCHSVGFSPAVRFAFVFGQIRKAGMASVAFRHPKAFCTTMGSQLIPMSLPCAVQRWPETLTPTDRAFWNH